MRINNNIMALNAHRQLGANQAAGSKSMERLSSGLRINRAGDDAAGLAISEKMRGQIRGLRQAIRNAQDGISLIQTAEGALNETHSILQRMRELAVQAGNDTNTDSDRAEIQKEMNQLTSELNRIGNTTEFNTQKLLDGSKTSSVVTSNVTDTGSVFTGEAISTVSGLADGAHTITVSASPASASSFTGTEAMTYNGTTATGDVTLDGTYSGSADATLTVTYTDNADASSFSSDTVASTGSSSGTAELTGTYSGAADGMLTITHNQGTNIASAADMTANGANTATAEVQINGTYRGDSDATLTVQYTTANGWEYSTDGSNFTAFTDTATIDGMTIDVTGITNEADGDSWTQSLTARTYTLSDGNGGTATIGSGTTTGTVSGITVDISNIDSTADAADAETWTQSLTAAVADAYAVTDGTNSATITLDGSGTTATVSGVTVDVAGITAESATNGDTWTQDLTAAGSTVYTADLNGGTGITVTSGGGSVTLTNGSESVDVDLGTFSFASGSNTITFDSATVDSSLSFQIGANTAQSFSADISDMRAQALGLSGTTSAGTIISADGSATATLTSTMEVSNGTDSTSAEYALDVSTHENATAAVTIIDDAINSVSAERSKLGAFQNRLDHTISNLGTSSENLQAAESRIRDLDMASEMMTFTKNNILQQAATAMLAQANMAPQSVLQLLG